MDKRPLTVRVARWSATHPWRAIALWIVFVATCFALGNAAGLHKTTDQDEAIGEAGRAGLIYDQAGYNDPATENILVTAKSGGLDQAAAKSAADDAVSRVKRPFRRHQGRGADRGEERAGHARRRHHGR